MKCIICQRDFGTMYDTGRGWVCTDHLLASDFPIIGSYFQNQNKIQDLNKISTPCPLCGMTSLFIGTGGHLTCSFSECKEPDIEKYINQLKHEAIRGNCKILSNPDCDCTLCRQDKQILKLKEEIGELKEENIKSIIPLDDAVKELEQLKFRLYELRDNLTERKRKYMANKDSRYNNEVEKL
jgi:hypothetical protein